MVVIRRQSVKRKLIWGGISRTDELGKVGEKLHFALCEPGNQGYHLLRWRGRGAYVRVTKSLHTESNGMSAHGGVT